MCPEPGVVSGVRHRVPSLGMRSPSPLKKATSEALDASPRQRKGSYGAEVWRFGGLGRGGGWGGLLLACPNRNSPQPPQPWRQLRPGTLQPGVGFIEFPLCLKKNVPKVTRGLSLESNATSSHLQSVDFIPEGKCLEPILFSISAAPAPTDPSTKNVILS